jgi:hypothetical protein
LQAVGPNGSLMYQSNNATSIDAASESPDTFVPNEGFTETQDTLNSIAFLTLDGQATRPW